VNQSPPKLSSEITGIPFSSKLAILQVVIDFLKRFKRNFIAIFALQIN
jgi:hypothetical protein